MCNCRYDYLPKNVKKEEIIELKKFLSEVGGVFVPPLGDEPEAILQFNHDTKKIEYVETEGLEGVETRAKNHKCLVGTLRKGVENAHAGIKQDKIWSSPLSMRYLDPVGKRMTSKFGLSPDYANCCKLQVLYGVSIGSYNEAHGKFHVSFADSKQQEELADLVDVRLNLINPFDNDVNFGFEIETYPKDDPDWATFTLKDLDALKEQFNIEIPTIAEEDEYSILDLGMGTYRWRR